MLKSCNFNSFFKDVMFFFIKVLPYIHKKLTKCFPHELISLKDMKPLNFHLTSKILAYLRPKTNSTLQYISDKIKYINIRT